MIRLDVVSFELFNLPPIRYDAFMRTFGAANALQATTQTGEDNLEEDVQTEEIETMHKWTQVHKKNYNPTNILVSLVAHSRWRH